jgi:hypothetical protein
LSYNWRKPNVYGHRRHRRIGHDIMPPDILWSEAQKSIYLLTCHTIHYIKGGNREVNSV